VKYLLLIYNDTTLLGAMPAEQFDSEMRDCISHADELRGEGALLDSQQLESATTAKTLRVREGRSVITDGPFAETKEVLGGFNLIEADSMEEAVRIAHSFPWAKTGSIEIRPIRDFEGVRRRVFSQQDAAATR
jgi:hypothetical protein